MLAGLWVLCARQGLTRESGRAGTERMGLSRSMKRAALLPWVLRRPPQPARGRTCTPRAGAYGSCASESEIYLSGTHRVPGAGEG